MLCTSNSKAILQNAKGFSVIHVFQCNMAYMKQKGHTQSTTSGLSEIHFWTSCIFCVLVLCFISGRCFQVLRLPELVFLSLTPTRTFPSILDQKMYLTFIIESWSRFCWRANKQQCFWKVTITTVLYLLAPSVLRWWYDFWYIQSGVPQWENISWLYQLRQFIGKFTIWYYSCVRRLT